MTDERKAGEMAADPSANPNHPAKFSDGILDVAAHMLRDWFELSEQSAPLLILDPFAGTGRIHNLAENPDWDTWGVEIEPEWAALHDRTFHGSALDLSKAIQGPWDGQVGASFDAVVTSPCYGNRMADQYLGERCPDCGCLCDAEDIAGDGGGQDHRERVHPCDTCGSTGRQPSRRASYAISLGRPVSQGSAGSLQWGKAYKVFHRRAWAEAVRVVRPGGLIVVNMKNHPRKGRVVNAIQWHKGALLSLGCSLRYEVSVSTPGWIGSNRDQIPDEEVVMGFERGAD